MKIIVGLGNPGKEYDGTRHNIGFAAVTALAEKYGISFDNSKKLRGMTGLGFIEGQKVLLLKPLTFMNNSGESVKEAQEYYKVPDEDILVIYDDINLDVGKLRIRAKGSAGGHNGIKSLIAHLGGEVFPRIRIGVGEKPQGWDLADYVLGRFSKEDAVTMHEAAKKAAEAAAIWAQYDINTTMNMFNSK